MKNILFALLSFILLSVPLAATAQQFGDFTYTSDGSAITITRYTGPGGEVTIPDTIAGLPVTRIGDNAFYQKPGLSSVTIPSSVISIGNSAFFLCTSLTSVTIPGSVSSIGDYAFGYCTSLASVTIPGGVTSIGDYAFALCTSLTSVTIPGSVASIGYRAFSSCTGLGAITVDATNASYISLDGVLFNKSQTTLIQCPGGKAGSYLIPGSVTSIGVSAFYDCNNLANVTIPGSVSNMGSGAFGDCTSLASVTISNGVTSIGDSAFISCSNLTSVTIPGSVTNMGSGAFGNCTSLASLTISNGVTSIGVSAFYNCNNLVSVTIPGSITSIRDAAFISCTNLKGVFFTGNAPSFGSDVFFGTSTTVYYLPGATGWGATFGERPALLWNPQVQTGDASFGVGPAGFGFNITGTADIPIVVEAATNLVTASWVPLQSLNLTNGLIYFSDPNWVNYPARNYRIRSP